ncbi:sigma-54 interaction domain-containing protein [Neolewinella persica]|uniref:sigma-54 interaction domain-containing protein n=1 Tax=Neolewinella persica TaxID=70998 RepID=UPI00035C3886|nr:sigma 54-interacting transcriptional regulator [Neolewinella persica]
MEAQLSRLLHIVQLPAFLASTSSELLYLNDEMKRLIGGENSARQRSLVGLGIFNNQAEFRGFIKGFTTVGPVQRVSLPATRLRNNSHTIWLNAVYIKEVDIVFCTISIKDKDLPEVVVNAEHPFAYLENLPPLVLMVNGKGQTSYLNFAAQRILCPAEADGKDIELNMSAIDTEFSEVSWRHRLKVAREKGCAKYETQFIRRDGKLLSVEVEICDVKGYPVHSAMLVATDISDRRKLEQELRSAQLELSTLASERARDKEFLKDQFRQSNKLEKTLSKNSSYRRVIEQIKKVAPTDSTVLIMGETGTGKELAARAIHAGSHRFNEPMVIVNCGALPRELIESELFGFRKGAFTGAIRDQAGRFELADRGTLFLDEIGEMPLELQTRLLRFLQEGEFTPVGGSEPIYVDVRIIAATNRNLEAMVKKGKFRSDLFFRLNVFPIYNPPLRERREDIPLLIDHFIQKHGRRLNTQVEGVHPTMLDQLMQNPFYGNIRELENIVERALITSEGRLLRLDWSILPQVSSGVSKEGQKSSAQIDLPVADSTLDEMQKNYIEAILRKTGGKVSGKGGAAEILGLKPQTLFSKIRKLGVKR